MVLSGRHDDPKLEQLARETFAMFPNCHRCGQTIARFEDADIRVHTQRGAGAAAATLNRFSVVGSRLTVGLWMLLHPEADSPFITANRQQPLVSAPEAPRPGRRGTRLPLRQRRHGHEESFP